MRLRGSQKNVESIQMHQSAGGLVLSDALCALMLSMQIERSIACADSISLCSADNVLHFLYPG